MLIARKKCYVDGAWYQKGAKFDPEELGIQTEVVRSLVDLGYCAEAGPEDQELEEAEEATEPEAPAVETATAPPAEAAVAPPAKRGRGRPRGSRTRKGRNEE